MSETSKEALMTCISCRVAFRDPEIQRSHYKSDWHRYNLKRKVAELPPVTSEEFQLRVLNQREVDGKALQPQNVYCEICHKSFGNPNAFANHLNSKKHKENEKSFVQQPDLAKTESDLQEIEDMDTDDSESVTSNFIDNNDCLFCSHHSSNFFKNLDHMTVAHSFFIPDIEYCTDLRGLLGYLGEKISEGFICLWCNENGKTFHSAESVQAHMLDKGHCKMIHEGVALAEYADFYDYSSSYPDGDENKAEEEVSVTELDGSDYQLVLPSGVTVGHRSLMKYYKQSANPNKAVVLKKSDKKLHKVLASYKALGWTATDQKAAARKARDIHFMKRMQSKYMAKLGVRNNKLQPHFRQQVLF